MKHFPFKSLRIKRYEKRHDFLDQNKIYKGNKNVQMRTKKKNIAIREIPVNEAVNNVCANI